MPRRLGLDIGAGEPLERYRALAAVRQHGVGRRMDGLNRLFSNDWVLARTFRDAGAGLIDRLPGLKTLFVQQAAGVAGDVPNCYMGSSPDPSHAAQHHLQTASP